MNLIISDKIKKIGLLLLFFLILLTIGLIQSFQAFQAPFIHETFLRHLLYNVVLVSVVGSIIFWAFSMFSILVLSKIRPFNDKFEVDGLIGGSISFLISLIFLIAYEVISYSYIQHYIEMAITLFIPLPTVLLASIITKNIWKGVIIGILIYFLMNIGVIILSLPYIPF